MRRGGSAASGCVQLARRAGFTERLASQRAGGGIWNGDVQQVLLTLSVSMPLALFATMS